MWMASMMRTTAIIPTTISPPTTDTTAVKMKYSSSDMLIEGEEPVGVVVKTGLDTETKTRHVRYYAAGSRFQAQPIWGCGLLIMHNAQPMQDGTGRKGPADYMHDQCKVGKSIQDVF